MIEQIDSPIVMGLLVFGIVGVVWFMNKCGGFE